VSAEEPMPWLDETWQRALAVVAHPDDMEYGAASAVARWTAQGKDVRYLLASRGEAGIESMPPADVAPLRVVEQQASCAAVGVSQVEFLDHPDGQIEPGIVLRRDLADAIRRHRPEAIISINFRDSWGGPSWNHVDHRVIGETLLDAVRDAANPWLFTDLPDPAWNGVNFVAFNASPLSTYAVDITDFLDAGVASLRCHQTYLEGLGGDPESAITGLSDQAIAAGERAGCHAATLFEVLTP
jgi:LmbE family N-acetylglucosaminyl deacetylase